MAEGEKADISPERIYKILKKLPPFVQGDSISQEEIESF
jgi:hypothetical protein